MRVFVSLFFEFQEIWLLTRKPDDPRWATLVDLRTKWAEVQQRLHASDLHGRCDEAAQATRDMLSAAAERLRQLSTAPRALSGRMRRRLQQKAQEVERYLRSFEALGGADGQSQTWLQVAQAKGYIREQLLAGYEDLAIRYVAKRRRFNRYRRHVLQQLKTGRFLTVNVSLMPRALLFELMLGLRFGHWFLTKSG